MTTALQVEVQLQKLGFYHGILDGQMGPMLIASIEAFQASAHLTADGQLGPITLSSLFPATDGHGAATMLLGSNKPGTRMSDAGITVVKSFEGLEDGDPHTLLLEPYICPAGVVTVGYGHALCDATGAQISAKRLGARLALATGRDRMLALFGATGLTPLQAVQLLQQDINEFSAGVTALLAHVPTQGEFDAMVSLAFNIGLHAFSQSSVLRFFNKGPIPLIALSAGALRVASLKGAAPTDIDTAFVSWSRITGVWTLGLFRRRLAEAMVFHGAAGTFAVTTAMKVV